MRRSQLDVMLLESGIVPDEATELANLLTPLADPVEIPTPSAALLALFGEDAPVETGEGRISGIRSRLRHGRLRGAVAGVVVLSISGVGATGLSAAANTLPGPWQHQVSYFSRQHLPFVFPEPRERLPLGHGAPGAGPGPARLGGRSQPSDAARSSAALTQGSRSLDGDRDLSPDGPPRPGRTPADRPRLISTVAVSSPQPVAASPGAAPGYLVKPAPSAQTTPVPGDATGKNPVKGFESPSKGPTPSPTEAPTKVPTQAPTQFPTKAPTQYPTQYPTQAPTQAPGKGADKGHDPVVGPKGPPNGPKGGPKSGPTSGPKTDPGSDPGETPGDGNPGGGVDQGGDAGGDTGGDTPRGQAGPADDGAGVSTPVERVVPRAPGHDGAH